MSAEEKALEGLKKYFESVDMELVRADLKPAGGGYFRGTAVAKAKGVKKAPKVEYDVLVEATGSVASAVAKA